MAEFSGNKEGKDEGAILEKEFSISLPYNVAKYFRRYTSDQFILKDESAEEPNIKLQLLRLRTRFSNALDNKFSSLRKASLRLSYDDIDFCGRLELKDVAKYAASSLTKDEQESLQISKPEFDQLLKLDMSISFKTLKRLFFDWNPSSEQNGLVRLELQDFAKNFLKLNKAFVKAGGRDNARLSEIYQQVVGFQKRSF